jgi:hypothetical protein
MVWVALAVLAGGWAGPAGADEFEKSLPVSGPVDLVINLPSSDVTVVGWDKSELRLDSDINLNPLLSMQGLEVRLGLAPKAEAPAVDGGDVAPDGGKSAVWQFVGQPDTVTVHLPARSRVTVSNVSGDVVLESIGGRSKVVTVSGDVILRAITDGVEIKTVSGDVRIEGARGDLAVKSVSGDISASGLDASLVEISTVSGEVHLAWVRAQQLRLASHSGDLVLSGPLDKQGSLRALSFSGDLVLTLPRGAGFEIDALSRSGEIRSDFPLGQGEKDDQQLRGRVGAGGAELSLSSHSGDIILKMGR